MNKADLIDDLYEENSLTKRECWEAVEDNLKPIDDGSGKLEVERA